MKNVNYLHQICAHSLTVEHPAYIRHMVPRLGSGPGSNPGGRTKYKYPRAAEARFREVPVGMADGVLKEGKNRGHRFFFIERMFYGLESI